MSRKMSNRMQTEVTYLFRESTIPGFSLIFGIKSKLRRAFWITVLIIFIALTANSLYEIIVEFLSFPIIVNVLVGDSRVLPFPAITICNLNPVHRGRFCSLQEDEIEKPSDVDQILCANLDKMLDLCEISGFLNEILEEGRSICIPKRRTAIRPLIRPTRRSITLNTTKSSRRDRIKRQLSIRDFVKGLRLFFSGDVIGLINSTGLLTGAGESGSFLDTAVVQFAKIYGIRINSSTDLIPALFLKGFADLTGCKFGSVYRSNGSIALENTLKNITDLILNSGCVWKLPKLFTLFQNSSKRLLNGLSSCTAPWVRSVLGLNSTSGTENQSESPWYILLDLLQSWLADLGRHHIEIARKLGHQSKDMIKGCYFGGKKCDYTEFESLFSSSYGNCFSYNLAATSDQMDEPKKLSGFTGPKFGLELTLNLEVDQYMPTSRETGAKIVIHDQFQKADPDQDAIHIPPGVVTYVGIQMINITRLPAPYRDKCSDEWTDDYDRKWAKASDHESYTSQFCLKLCLQKYTLNKCKCWTMAAPPPTESFEVQCDVRQNRDQADCVERVREQYYAGELACDCPPRCNEKMYEKFISTGTEAAQCSALSSGGEDSPNDHKENTAKVIIYYQTLSFTEIRQDVKYTWSSIIGAIGGILGVYLGFSFIAIYEVFEIILRAALHIFRPSNSKIKIYDN